MIRKAFTQKLSIFSFLLTSALTVAGQSTTQEFATPVVSNEISGTIKARDIGDSRLTTYYYALNSDQGDLFINIVTKNLSADIDVFTIVGLRPMTKVVVYADYGETETGRAIYLRKSEKLLLRIQGRSPNDDDATYRLKFAGSFVAARADEQSAGTEVPKVTAENRSGIRVNSIGTILPPLPKAVEPVAEKAEPSQEPALKADAEIATAEKTPATDVEKEEKASGGLTLVVTDPVKAEEKAPSPPPTRRAANSRSRTPVRRSQPKPAEPKPPTETTAEAEIKEPSSTKPAARIANTRGRTPKKPVEPKPDPLASINLVVQFKDGSSLEKKMSEVFKFSVDKGILTVILKNGIISRYPIVDVAKLTIE